MRKALLDLNRAVNTEITFINRNGYRQKDRNRMLDCRYTALEMVKVFHNEYGLSKQMRKYFTHKISVAVQSCLNK